MKQGWEIKKLEDVCNIIGGGTPSKKNSNFYKGDILWATVRDMKSEIISDTEFKITPEAVRESSTNIIEKGNVIIATRVGLGKVCLIYKDTAINQDLRGIVPKKSKQLDNKFLFRWFQSISHLIVAEGTGATVQGVKLPFIKELPIPVPPLSQQQRIASILDETFAAIYKAKANAEQNLKNAKDLFESYLNSVQASKVDLGSLVDITTGKLNSNAAVQNGKYPFFTCSRDIYAIDIYAFDLEAILLAGNNASGDFNVKHYKGKFNAYQRTYIITVNEKQKILYRFLYFQLLKSLKEFKEMSVGANTKFLKLGMIQGLKIALPTIAEQQSIVQQLDVLQAETQKLEALYQKKINDLEELKKSILQKAFAGELKTEKVNLSS